MLHSGHGLLLTASCPVARGFNLHICIPENSAQNASNLHARQYFHVFPSLVLLSPSSQFCSKSNYNRNKGFVYEGVCLCVRLSVRAFVCICVRVYVVFVCVCVYVCFIFFICQSFYLSMCLSISHTNCDDTYPRRLWLLYRQNSHLLLVTENKHNVRLRIASAVSESG